MSKKGIDVSSNNGVVNWQSVKSAGYEFAIIRLGYGSDILTQDDSQFFNNVKECERLGIPYGVYLYSYALNLEEANSEVSHVLRLLKNVGSNFKYGVWFDMEDTDGYKKRHGMPSNEMLVDICYTFCEAVEKAGYYTGIYANLSWLNNQLNNSKLDRFDKWVAQWSSKCTYNKNYSIWQYTDNENINGKVFDCSYLIKDFANHGTISQPVSKPNIIYQVYSNKSKRYYGEITNYNTVNSNGYAGGSSSNDFIGGIRAKLSNGIEVLLQVHTLNGKWYSKVSSNNYKRNDTRDGNSYAGVYGRDIDGLAVYCKNHNIKYRVYANGKWYGWVSSNNANINNLNSGMAGVLGQRITRIQMYVE